MISLENHFEMFVSILFDKDMPDEAKETCKICFFGGCVSILNELGAAGISKETFDTLHEECAKFVTDMDTDNVKHDID